MLNYQPSYLGVTKEVILFQFSSKIPFLQRTLWDPGEGARCGRSGLGEQKVKGVEEIFEEIITENFQKLMTDTNHRF